MWDGGRECRQKTVNIEELEGEETVRLQEGWHCSYGTHVGGKVQRYHTIMCCRMRRGNNEKRFLKKQSSGPDIGLLGTFDSLANCSSSRYGEQLRCDCLKCLVLCP